MQCFLILIEICHKIISGVFLGGVRNENEKRLGMTVTVELFGLPADSHRVKSSSAHRVRASSANFFNVAYSDSGFTFKKVLFSKDKIKIEIKIILIFIKITLDHYASAGIIEFECIR